MKRQLLSLVIVTLNLFALSAQTGQVHILSVNDMHAAVERFPQLAAIADSLRTLYPDLLVLSAGDNRTGNPINDFHPVSSKPMVDLMNATGFNYSALGNHEFDAGVDGLRTVINNSYCKYLCANIAAPDSLRLHIEPFAFVARNGLRIGILGLVQTGITGTPDAHPKYFDKLTFRPVNETARDYAWMRRECDVFILLTHNGFESDLELAGILPQCDLLIGGHSHTLLEPSQTQNGVLITQDGRDLKYASFTTLTVQDGKVTDRQSQIIDVKNHPRRNPQVQAMVDSFSQNPTLQRVLTRATADFTQKEQLGCLMADAMRAEAGADIAVQNSGGVRYETKEKGPFTVNDVYRLDPFGNEMVEFNLTGEEIERMLAAICDGDDYGPAFVSGIRYSIDLGKDNHTVKRVKITNDDGSKFDRKRTYRVVMSSYVATVSDYEKEDEGRNLYMVVSDAIINYLDKQPSLDYTGVSRMSCTMEAPLAR